MCITQEFPPHPPPITYDTLELDIMARMYTQTTCFLASMNGMWRHPGTSARFFHGKIFWRAIRPEEEEEVYIY